MRSMPTFFFFAFTDGESDGTVRKMYLPLLFYWNSRVLIGLQYHQCRLDFQFSDSSAVSGVDPTYVPCGALPMEPGVTRTLPGQVTSEEASLFEIVC